MTRNRKNDQCARSGPGPSESQPPRLAGVSGALLACLFLLSGESDAFAQLEGDDNFNDNIRDLAKWGTTDTTFGNGLLSEANQRLHYVVNGSVGAEGDWAVRQWQTNHGRFSDDWEVQLDVNLPLLTLEEDAEVEIGLGVGNAADIGDGGTITLNTYQAGGVARQFWSDIWTNQSDSLSDAVAATASTSASVRIRWTAASRVLSFEYDSNGSVGGYAWTLLASRIIGAGGYDWGMTEGSLFAVAVFAGSYGQAVTSDSAVFGDNFIARTSTPGLEPTLRVVPAGVGQVTIAWTPATPGFVLQEALDLTGAWSNSISGATNPVTVNALPPRRFFRLFKP